MLAGSRLTDTVITRMNALQQTTHTPPSVPERESGTDPSMQACFLVASLSCFCVPYYGERRGGERERERERGKEGGREEREREREREREE